MLMAGSGTIFSNRLTSEGTRDEVDLRSCHWASPNNYIAYAPDCISTVKTWDEMLVMIREALIVSTATF